MKHVRPPILTKRTVIEDIGVTTCPYCKSESTQENSIDVGWVEGPVSSSPTKYICLGCCEDIYSTCADGSFYSHPYFDIVVDAASVEGISVEEFRLSCLRQQLHFAKQRASNELGEKYVHRIKYLNQLLDSLLH